MSLLDEATKHIREAIMLGRTDIIKKLLEEVWCSLSDAKGRKYGLFFSQLWTYVVTLVFQIKVLHAYYFLKKIPSNMSLLGARLLSDSVTGAAQGF